MSVVTSKAVKAAKLMKAGSYGKARDIISHVIYDTLPFSSSTPSMRFFASPQGTTKTLQQTNLTDASKLPTGHEMTLEFIRPKVILNVDAAPEYQATLLASAIKVFEESTISFKIVGREFDLQLPGSYFLPSFAAVDQVATASTNTLSSSRVGDFLAPPAFKLDIPIVLESQANFNLVVDIDTGATGVSAALTALGGTLVSKLRWEMKGILKRAK